MKKLLFSLVFGLSFGWGVLVGGEASGGMFVVDSMSIFQVPIYRFGKGRRENILKTTCS